MSVIRDSSRFGLPSEDIRSSLTFIGDISELKNMNDMITGDVFIVTKNFSLKCKYKYDGNEWKLSEHINPDAFVADNYVTDLGNGDIQYFIVRTADKLARLSVNSETEGKTRLRSYIDFTTTADGTAVNVFNRLVDGPDATVNVFNGPTVTDTGTQRGDILIPAGQGGNATGGSTRGGEFTWIPPNSELLISILNDSGQVRDLSVSFDLEEFDVI